MVVTNMMTVMIDQRATREAAAAKSKETET